MPPYATHRHANTRVCHSQQQQSKCTTKRIHDNRKTSRNYPAAKECFGWRAFVQVSQSVQMGGPAVQSANMPNFSFTATLQPSTSSVLRRCLYPKQIEKSKEWNNNKQQQQKLNTSTLNTFFVQEKRQQNDGKRRHQQFWFVLLFWIKFRIVQCVTENGPSASERDREWERERSRAREFMSLDFFVLIIFVSHFRKFFYGDLFGVLSDW